MKLARLSWAARFHRNLAVVERFAEGASLRVIASELGVSHVAIVGILADIGLKASGRQRWRNAKPERNEEVRKARALGASYRELAARFAISRTRAQQIVDAASGDDRG